MSFEGHIPIMTNTYLDPRINKNSCPLSKRVKVVESFEFSYEHRQQDRSGQATLVKLLPNNGVVVGDGSDFVDTGWSIYRTGREDQGY